MEQENRFVVYTQIAYGDQKIFGISSLFLSPLLLIGAVYIVRTHGGWVPKGRILLYGMGGWV